MSTFNVELKVVDDSYEIEIGFGLEGKLIQDLKNGLVGKIKSLQLLQTVLLKSCMQKIY